MKINFTKKEYQTLVEMLLIADWIIHSHEEAPRSEAEPYSALRKKVLAYFKEMGMGEAFRYDPEADDYFETAAYEERSPHMQFIDAHDEQMFWSQLAEKLAERDFAEEVRTRGEVALSDVDRFVKLSEITDAYEQELAEHGLDNVRVVSEPPSRMH